jgi:hypothetical protein
MKNPPERWRRFSGGLRNITMSKYVNLPNESSSVEAPLRADPLRPLPRWEGEDLVYDQLLIDDFDQDELRDCCARYGLEWGERHHAFERHIEDGRWAEVAVGLGIDSASPREAVKAWLAARDPDCALSSPAWRRLTPQDALRRLAVIRFREASQPTTPAQQNVTPPPQQGAHPTPQQAAVLWVLREADPVHLTVAELARRLRPDRKSIRRYLRPLRDLGLVTPAAPTGGSGLTPAGLTLARTLPGTPAILALLRPAKPPTQPPA